MNLRCIGKMVRLIPVANQLEEENCIEGVVYVCVNEGLYQLRCPCGCGDVIKGQLFPLSSPSWKVDMKTNSMTPSIRRDVRCMAHFTITNGLTH